MWILMPAWVIFIGLLSCWQVSAATIGSTSHIPVPGFPDIIVTTFPLPDKPKGEPTNGNAAQLVSLVDRPCTNTCSGVPGWGPNQFDCSTIAYSLYSTGGQAITLSPFLVTEWSFRSCKVTVTNQSPVDSVMTNQASVAAVSEKLAADCNAGNNAGGGLCLYQNVSAAVFVQHT
ncbi:hypothetical protein RSOLAG1IB_07688 [Rhizoctonia solani AG-1 IB]|uniref:Uncharacterized protein n=1 Tax=Thanatephorus cucumeris (strain AG1-IB / isolate 7/3/14) TaxID=1108050 RepID=A0A0B7FJD0_THACB|nr:hypothetical protein RSOLAG1IB_07688 [Rhizoctonia solani AG-1 IB]